MNTIIESAVDVSMLAQRNYDLSRIFPEKDLETLIYVASHSPSKQNEVHYRIRVYTDQSTIRKIYECTKRFAVYRPGPLSELRDGELWQDDAKSVHNSQILSNVLFVYEDDEDPARCGEHMLAQQCVGSSYVNKLYVDSKATSIGVSVGQLILSASLLGYKTGVCSAMNDSEVAKVINSSRLPKLLVGIGYGNTDIDRRLHAETLNKEVFEEGRNGDLNERWRFPSFEPAVKVSINGIDI